MIKPSNHDSCNSAPMIKTNHLHTSRSCSKRSRAKTLRPSLTKHKSSRRRRNRGWWGSPPGVSCGREGACNRGGCVYLPVGIKKKKRGAIPGMRQSMAKLCPRTSRACSRGACPVSRIGIASTLRNTPNSLGTQLMRARVQGCLLLLNYQ